MYSKAIMMEYLPLEGQLFTLLGRLQRAARMFMDPMVNLGLLTPEAAVDFMMKQIGLSRAMASSEADRYALLAAAGSRIKADSNHGEGLNFNYYAGVQWFPG